MNADHEADAGFTLLEAVIAMVIFGIVASSTAAVLVRAVGGSSDNRARAAAANVAAQTMDGLRQSAQTGQGYTDLTTRALPDVVVQGRTYSVSTSVSSVLKAGGGSPCTSGGLSDEVYKKVGVMVTWPAAGSVKPVRSDTIVQNPGVATDLTKGALGVVVAGPGGLPEARVPVTLSSGDAKLTDDSGCAYFSGLAGGTYTATASAPGHVDQSGAATASQSAGVQAASATVVNLPYATATTPRITFATVGADGNADPSYTWFGTSAYTLKNTAADRSGSTATNTVSPTLYPFASGYDVWLGPCAGEAPASRVNFATLPGTSPQVAVPVGGLAISNTSAASVDVVVRHTDSTSCPTSYTGTLPAGVTFRAALPFGQWTVTSAGGAVASPAAVTLTSGAPTAAVSFP